MGSIIIFKPLSLKNVCTKPPPQTTGTSVFHTPDTPLTTFQVHTVWFELWESFPPNCEEKIIRTRKGANKSSRKETGTLPEANSLFAPENEWLEYSFPFGIWSIFRGENAVSFREGSEFGNQKVPQALYKITPTKTLRSRVILIQVKNGMDFFVVCL